jgi:hypothetical protein
MTFGSRGLTGFGVALEGKHNFRGSVPPCGNVFSHVSCIFFRVDAEASRKTEVADFEFAIGVHEQVTGLEIAMQYISAVYVFQPTENLVDEGLEVSIGQRLTRANNGSEITFHEFWRVKSIIASLFLLRGCQESPYSPS